MGRKPRWSWLRVYTGESLTRPLGLSRPCPFPGPQGTFVLTHFVLVQGTGPGIFDVLLTQILYQHWHTWFSPQHLGILFSQSLKGMLCRPLDGSHACLYPGPLSRKCKDSHNSSHYFRTPLSNEATGNSPHPHHLWNDELCRNFFQWQKMPVLSGQYKPCDRHKNTNVPLQFAIVFQKMLPTSFDVIQLGLRWGVIFQGRSFGSNWRLCWSSEWHRWRRWWWLWWL